MSLSIGILGFGYLGKELLQTLGTHANVWVTRQQELNTDAHPKSPIPAVTFQWNNPDTWSNLPDDASTLIITIPPFFVDDAEAEQSRLHNWCTWLQTNRRDCKRCVYISSTGVYPNLPGDWTEQSHFDCDSLKGQLRLTSERTLADYFETTVIRPGAIYGNNRNIGRSILSGKPIPRGEQPVHRIHVHDLARLTAQVVRAPQFPDLLNAVDLESETTRNVAAWLMKQSFFPKSDESTIEFRSDFQTRKFNLTQPDRKISNQRLVKEYGFTFIYPTYKEGLAKAFTDPPSQQQ